MFQSKSGFVLGVTFGGLSIRRKWGNFPPLHLLETMKARGSAEQLHHNSLQTLALPLFYCPALSGCNRQGRKREKIKIADVRNVSNSSPLKISAGVRCDPGIPARLITQRDRLLWWRFITEQSSYLRFCISHLGLASEVRLLVMSPTTYPIRGDTKEKKLRSPVEIGDGYQSSQPQTGYKSTEWYFLLRWRHERSVREEGFYGSYHIGSSHLCALVTICEGQMGA